LVQSQRESFDNFHKNNTSTSKHPESLAIVVVEEPANANLEDEGPIEDNVGIDIDETMMSTCLIQMLYNIIGLMRILCVLWIRYL
jgi:hypothetical protein